MSSSTQWTKRYEGAVMNTFGPPQRVLVRGQGARVWDEEGNALLDFLGGIAVNALGHAHPALIDAVTSQLSTLGHISNFFASEPQIELAEKLISLADGAGSGGNGKVFFTNSGTEAVEAAFKLTRRTGRTKVVAAEGSFHGRTMGALALTSKVAYREPFEPLPGDVVFVPYGDADALKAAVDAQTAAVVLEPIQGEAGVITPPDSYLAAAREIASEHGALLWLDEIQTGMGRTGSWFNFGGSTPDIVTVAKGLGGGIPIGACLAFGDAGELLQPGNHGSTFGGNPMAAAAALAVIAVIEDEGLLDNVVQRGDQLADAFASDGRGLLRAVVLGKPVAADVQRRALDAGLIVNAPTPDRLRLAPPLNVTAAEVDEAIVILTKAIEEASA